MVSFGQLTAPKQIVVATDLTDSAWLVPHAITQARLSQASITLVHSIDVPVSAIGVPAEQEARARAALRQMADEIEREGLACSITLTQGDAASAVQREIERSGATRLLLGTHGHGHLGQWILGSTANALLLASNVPVFVTGPHMSAPQAHSQPRRLLHPVSLKGNYRDSASFAIALAETYKAELAFLHVVDPSIMSGSYVEELLSRTENELKSLMPSHAPPPRVQTVMDLGEPVLDILKFAMTHSIDWIVMNIERDLPWWSTRNNSTYQVIAESPCPVLAVRTRMFAASRLSAAGSKHPAKVSSSPEL